MATTWNQDINAGTDWVATFELLNDNKKKRNITGCTFASKAKRHYTSAAFQEILIEVDDPTNGRIRTSLTDVQTTLMKSGKYLYDIEMTLPSTLKVTLDVANMDFVVDEVITGGTSGATGIVTHVPTTDGNITSVKFKLLSGTFAGTETISGTSTRTATMISFTDGFIERVVQGVITIRPEVT